MNGVIKTSMLLLRRKGTIDVGFLMGIILIVLIILLIMFSNNAFITYFMTEGGDEILDAIPFSDDTA